MTDFVLIVETLPGYKCEQRHTETCSNTQRSPEGASAPKGQSVDALRCDWRGSCVGVVIPTRCSARAFMRPCTFPSLREERNSSRMWELSAGFQG